MEARCREQAEERPDRSTADIRSQGSPMSGSKAPRKQRRRPALCGRLLCFHCSYLANRDSRAAQRSSITRPIRSHSESLHPFRLANARQWRTDASVSPTICAFASADSPQISPNESKPSTSLFPASPKMEVTRTRAATGLMLTSKTGANTHPLFLRMRPRFRRWSSVLCNATENTTLRKSSVSSQRQSGIDRISIWSLEVGVAVGKRTAYPPTTQTEPTRSDENFGSFPGKTRKDIDNRNHQELLTRCGST